MRVIPLTSILSHKGRGCRSPKRDDTLSLEIRELFKHPLTRLPARLLAAGIYDGPAMGTLAYLAFPIISFHLKIEPVPVNLQ